MYRSLMFKSNPFAEELHRDENKAIRPLQMKNYSFTKIEEKRQTKNNTSNNLIVNKSSVNKNRYLISSPHSKNKQVLCRSKDQAVQRFLQNTMPNPQKLHPQKLPIKQHDEFKSRERANKMNFTNNKLSNFGQQAEYSSTKTNQKEIKLQRQNKIQKEMKVVNQSINSSPLQKFNQEKNKANNMKEKPSFSSNFKGQGNYFRNSFNTCDNQSKQGHKNNILKSTLYQSIDLDNLFEKIQSKVNQTEKEKDKKQEGSSILSSSVIEQLRKQAKTPNPKSRTPFDQFNLKYLISKKKNFNIQNQSTTKGSNLPYFQSFTSRDRVHQMMQSRGNSRSPMQRSNFQSGQMTQSWGVSRRKRLAKITIDDNGVIHEEGGVQNKGQTDESSLRMSLKISNLRHMLKADQAN